MVSDPPQPHFKEWYLLRAPLETLAEYDKAVLVQKRVAGQPATRLPHGMDLKLPNLVSGPNNFLYFVDLFGPKELDGNRGWLTYNT